MLKSSDSEQLGTVFDATRTSGFAQLRDNGSGVKERTPLADKSSILASKPAIGGKLRHQQGKSPDRGPASQANMAHEFYNVYGPHGGSDMRKAS